MYVRVCLKSNTTSTIIAFFSFLHVEVDESFFINML